MAEVSETTEAVAEDTRGGDAAEAPVDAGTVAVAEGAPKGSGADAGTAGV